MEIYEVCVTMREHPSLRDRFGELMDVWLIDHP
jgi:hypothetical protein